MNKKKHLKAIFASFLMASTVLAACGGDETAEKPKENKQAETEKKTEETKENNNEETKEVNVEDTDAAKQAAAYSDMMSELVKAKEGQEVNWDTVQQQYEAGLQKDVAELSPEFDQAIQAALTAGKSGEMEPIIAVQLTDKTIQSYFYQNQKALQKEAVAALTEDKKEDANLAFAQIKHLTEKVFIPTAEKRDKYYELSGDASLVENINSGLSAQEEALNAGNAEDFQVYLQVTDKSIYRSYYLAAKSYAEKIEAGVKEGKDKQELSIMQAEAWGFYQAIKGSLSGGDEAAAAQLDKLFTLNTTDPAAIKAAETNALFAKAVAGKIKGYYEKAPNLLAENNAVEAKVSAMEGNMFLKMLQGQMTEKLGEEKTQAVFADAEAWYNAIAENKPEDAKAKGDAVISAVDGLL
ncbi:MULTISPECIES: hypothetical protein [unclassified Bacillus (in: firmicutes)]|uniref:hypothetical protein n=1 Tax=unclassified Bacillus (in: firmicutes) TaxID=185979 RepID=UPI001BE6B5B7|nr:MULTISPECIES: hypothetical protein [unclassified Bacillus (in: firmicutes)]MBT2638555.1 hypothetical protein [Bacillus sp. ISL-39]MBT2660560.1 hypothetical protein [Bacillus sp. ISL-45]